MNSFQAIGLNEWINPKLMMHDLMSHLLLDEKKIRLNDTFDSMF